MTVSALQSPEIVKLRPQLPVYQQTHSANVSLIERKTSEEKQLVDEDDAVRNCIAELKKQTGLGSTEALLNASIEQACLSSKLESSQGLINLPKNDSLSSVDVAPLYDELEQVSDERSQDPLELTMTGFSIDAIRGELARIKNHKAKVDQNYNRVMSQLKSPDTVAKYSRNNLRSVSSISSSAAKKPVMKRDMATSISAAKPLHVRPHSRGQSLN